jgi:16S rRNA processing protein RimM
VDLVEIGRVTRPHGIRGELRVQLHWPESDAFEHAGSVTLERDGRTLFSGKVVSARRAEKAVLLKLQGVDDRNAAESFRDALVSVPRSALPPLEPGEYYLCDLVGAKVVAPGAEVGEVVEVRAHPSVDTIVVKTPDGTLLEQPLTDPWIVSVDAEKKLVELSTTDGLI